MTQSCATCKHLHKPGNDKARPACRRYPPQTHFIVVLRPSNVMVQGGSMKPVEEQRSAFPAVALDWACGEWTPSIEATS